MHTGSLRKWALALTFWLALHTSSLRAQIFTNDLPLQATTTGSNPVDFEFRADGTLIAEGNNGVGSLLTADQGAGTRMLWFPSLVSFRVGSVDGTEWDQSNIGFGSIAMGVNTTASGYYTVSLGRGTAAWANDSTAIGFDSHSIATWSTALGGYVTTYGFGSTAMGFETVASGGGSTAMGIGSSSNGNYSTAMGQSNAYGDCSTAMGSSTAGGDFSTAMGDTTDSGACFSVALGAYNVGAGDPNNWVPTDPLFEIGNGGDGSGDGNPSATGPSDALIVYKNGNAVLQGTLQVAPGGDIPMYTGE
jgi:hypothetical protein